MGGGTGGCSMAAKFADTFKNQVVIIEPNEVKHILSNFYFNNKNIEYFYNQIKYFMVYK